MEEASTSTAVVRDIFFPRNEDWNYLCNERGNHKRLSASSTSSPRVLFVQDARCEPAFGSWFSSHKWLHMQEGRKEGRIRFEIGFARFFSRARVALMFILSGGCKRLSLHYISIENCGDFISKGGVVASRFPCLH